MASPEPVAAEFRILDLQPGAGNDAIVGSLRTARLGDGERYEALSYVWGDSAGAKAVVTVSGQRIAVTASLHAALSRLRSPTVPRALWIDQLCIDQWDPQHKAGQVKLMRHIYRQCVQCVIWFGEIDEPTAGFGRVDAEVAFAFVEALAARTADDGPEVAPAYLAFHGNKRALRAFVAFAPGHRGHPWWSRIWTVQEAVLPPEAVLSWGPLQLPFEALARAADNLIEIPTPAHLAPFFDPLESVMGNFMATLRGLKFIRELEDPLDALNRWRSRGATDTRDKVYALMGLYSTLPLPSVQDYSYEIPVTQLFANVTVDLIRHNEGLAPLVGRRGPMSESGLAPSWMLDLSEDPAVDGHGYFNHIYRYSWFSADGDAELSLEILHQGSVLGLQGIAVDTIVETGDAVLSPEPLETPAGPLRDLLEAWEAMGKRHQRGAEYTEGQSYDEAFWRTLLGDITKDQFPIRRAEADDGLQVASFRRQDGGSWDGILDALLTMVANQAFFVTKSGYIGITATSVRPGDEVWVLLGGDTPFVLRPRAQAEPEANPETPAERLLIGNAYVHGIMDGETMDRDDVVAQAVHLY